MKIEHDTINIDLNSKPKWFHEVSPLGKVPVYVNNVTCTPDSVEIINLLAKENGIEMRKILSEAELNGFMEQIVSLWYKICYYKGVV
jgi:glutathione S-transferase